jgi:RHS repeat-associated protein
MVYRSRRTILEGIRQFVALLLSFALPGACLPADSMHLVNFRAAHTRSPQVSLPPGGLDAFAKVPALSGKPSPRIENPKSTASYSLVSLHGSRNLLLPSVGVTAGSAGVVPYLSPVPVPPAPSSASGPNISTITSNFNGTGIAAGDSIWFNSVMKVSGVPSTGATITVSGATVQFTANGTAYNLPVPDSVITFSSSASSSTTTFDAVHNQWNTTVPVAYSGNVFLAGFSEYLSTALPGGINPVNWTATFYTDKSGVSLQWQWAAAVYTSFSANYSSLGVKPIDATSGSAYLNSDDAGTAENYKSYVTGGARGGGGSNWTGSYSGTASVSPQVAANHAPVANAGANQTVFIDTTVQLNGTGSYDPDGLRITYSWSFVSIPTGSSATLSGASTPTPTFYVDKMGNYTVQLIVSDGELSSAPSQVVVSTKNSPPVANAGPNQTVTTRTTVQLNGSGSSDVDGDPLTYRWVITSAPQGSTATLSNPNIVNPTFVTNEKGTYVVQLIVNDGTVDSAPSQVTISDVNSPPVANAGPNQTLVAGTTVQLNGSGSTDIDGDPLTYSWSILSTPQSSTATLSSATIVNPTVFADEGGTYVIQLIVNDGTVNSQPSTVTITAQNTPPVANAGPNQTVTTDTMVQLDGSKSTDVDGDPLTYQWSIVSAPQGSTATLSNPSLVNPTFITDEKGTYVVQLIVNDGTVNSSPSQVTISDVNSPPVANPGPNQTINVGTTVQLDGSHSTDVDGDKLTYSWAILSTPSGSSAVLSSTTAVQPTFIADRVGTYVIQLVVNDGTVNSQPKTVTISTNDVPPVANPGPSQSVTVGAVVALNGSGSTDSDGLQLSYQWALLTVPAGSNAALTSTSSVSTSFTADVPGNYVVQLIVNDGFLSSPPATLTISTSDVPPAANPGPNQTVSVGATVQLDGTASTDSDHQPVTYRWAILSQPSGGNATLSSATAAKPTFVAALAGLYVVQLIVNDGFLDSSPVTMTVTAQQLNQPPTVSAGPNQTIELPVNTATLNGSASSSAPAGSPVTVQWSQVSGPGTVTFSNPTQPVTQATFPGVGTFTLQLSATVTATGLSNSAQTTVVVAPANQPPVVTVGPDQTILFPTYTASLTGTATDDGFPVGSSLAISWSKVIGPGTVTFSSPNQPNTQASFSLPGNYILRLSASDGQYTSSGSMRVAYVAPSGGGLNVSAGPDQVIVFPNAATLTGTATDAYPFLGEVITVGWSEISGPGTATFASPSSLGTSVTLSTSGVYVLQLTATNGIFTASSDVKIYAGNVKCTLSNKGTDFWLMFTGAAYQITPTTPPRQLQLFISSDVATSGTVSVPGQGLNQPFTVTPGEIATVNLPQSVQVTSSDLIETNGIHITAQNPVAVYGLNYVPFATDGYLGLPTNALGTSYLVASYRNTIGLNGSLTYGTEFGVTATQDNTTVTIIPTADGGQIDSSHPSGTRPAQQPFTIQLNQGQTYQLRNIQEDSQLSLTSTTGPPVDFTGTVVTSDKPVAVFGAHDCADVPNGSLYCNSLVEQLPPTNLWGQNFVTMPLASEYNGDVFRFVAQTDGTHVQVNHQEVAVLGKGQFFEQLIKGPAEITANNPILTVQYAQSGLAGGNNDTDPTMIVVPPFEQFGGSYTVNTPTSGYPFDYINVIAPTSAAQSGGVLLDGAPLAVSVFQPIGTSPFSGAQLNVTVGPHTLTAGLPFGVWVYGFNAQDAYGYTGGVCFASGVPGNTLVASPKAATNQITSQATVQATISNPSGQPLGGTGVTFTLTGINPQTFYGLTDANGVAKFSYTSLKTGSDLVTITAGTASDTASFNWVSNGPNQPPVVSAGPNQTISLPTNSVFLNGSVIDDGLPVGGTLTSTWSQISGPAPVLFGSPNQPETSATFSQAGTYVLQLTGNDSQLSTSANVTVTVLPPNQPPVVSAGVNHAFMWFQDTALQLIGSATDDGLPVGSTLTTQWSEVTGAGIVSFDTPNLTTTFAAFPAPGTYVVQLSANDTQFTTTSRATIQAFGPVTANLGPNLQTAVNTPITINANVLVGGLPPTSSMPLQLLWRWTAGPNGANVTFGSPNTAATTATFDTPGTYQLSLTTSDSTTPQYGTQNCCLIVNVAAANTPLPSVSLSAPLDGAQITAPTPVTGSVSSGTWTLDYALQDDFNPMNFTTLATGTSTVSNGALGTFNPTILLNGTYLIRLTSVNAAGQFARTSVTVSVARNMKVGVFSLSFNDLTVPVSGIPIQVIRSYDSRDKGLGDFGVGWRLSLSNIRVQKSRSLSPNWQETQTFSGYLPNYCLFATDNKIVTVTFPDGRVFTFQTGGTQMCQQIGEITTGTLTFTEQPGPANTAGATLTAADGGQFLVDGNAPGAVSLVGYDGNPYNPTAFVLQTADGTKLTVDQKLGLTAVTDKNGNTLTITPNGITSSAGKSVPFIRDELGRITRITDLDGKNLYYTYNSNGDLAGFTDRAADPMAYAYDNSHDLTGITTADGKQVLTNTFDGSGRLTATKDGNGFTVSFSHNVPGQTETVTDRNGNPTTYLYDTDGNVTQVTDALGNVTTSTYDASDNKLSETNALNKTSNYTYDLNGNRLTETDPLHHTTTYTYNALNKPLTIQDANGHTTTNTYDTNGNVLTTIDANGKITTNTYSSSGLLLTTQDPNGKTTSFGYDGAGNLLTQTDALGTVTSYAYDGNGNRTSQSVTRTLPGGSRQTLTSAYAYDGNGRLVKTTNPDNSTTQTIYNSIGQQVTAIDALGRQTAYRYDADGHVTLTTYPDSTTESTVYDRNGNRTQFTDRTNVLTVYTYDALNRLTQSQRGSSSPTINKTSYDAIGQVLTTTDPNGKVTTYAYDDAGRRTQVTNALSQITTFVYDAAGNQTSFQDANNNSTTYTYDNDNRRIQVTYPDSKFETTTYDPLGRVTARTDANSKTTQYGYDAVGRLTSVTDALGQITSYAYDEVGNRISQTDANNHTTTYAYDQRGRRTQRTLPLGQSESYSYDAAGNLKTRTDFNGKTTTYAYDSANRLLSKTADPYFAQNHIGAASVTYAYNTYGQRSSMTDASGTTIYAGYDSNGHPNQVYKPAGSLFYTYDPASNLTSLAGGGFTVRYGYDALERLNSVIYQDQYSTNYTATNTYDNVGNLAAVTYPNGVVHTYTYDTRNRLTNLGVNKSATALASYAYTLDAAGHRTGVTELSGRTVSYGYDNIYRLTSETIASDPSGMNGAVSYAYDPVGNRTQKVSTLPGYPGGLTNYNANDQISADTYDSDGNTTASNGVGYAYDFENRLVQAGGGISIVYDGDGNRVSKTVAGVTTQYLVDDRNPTGYAQVVYEGFSGSTAPNREGSHNFYYGLELVAELRTNLVNGSQAHSLISFDYDGHGSVRALTDQNGTVTDTYDYDAYGNLIHSTGSTPNNYLFAGEQFDPDLNLYYNRARYLNVSTGRFWTMDTYQGDAESPLSLHKYLYASSSPVDRVDPSGNFGLEEAMVAIAVSIVLLTMSSCSAPGPSSFVEVKQVAYQREENGLYIALGAYTKSRSPQFPEYNWVQYVTTNAIQPKFQAYEQPDVPFIDPPRPNGVPPFFYVGKEPRPSFGNYDLCFDDRPLRDPSNYPNVHGTIYWRAELFLVGVSPAGSSSYAKITRITYGFTVAQNGNMTWDDLNISKLVP